MKNIFLSAKNTSSIVVVFRCVEDVLDSFQVCFGRSTTEQTVRVVEDPCPPRTRKDPPASAARSGLGQVEKIDVSPNVSRTLLNASKSV